MSLADLAARPPRPPHNLCGTCWVIQQAPELADVLHAALDNPAVTDAEVQAELRALGHEVTESALARHRLRQGRHPGRPE